MTASDSDTKKKQHKDWDEVFKIVKLNKEKKTSLLSLQQVLEDSKAKLNKAVQDFIELKNKAWSEAEKITAAVHEKAIPLFSSRRALNIVLWVHKVWFCLAFS